MMAPIAATSANHLWHLVRETIERAGPTCDLNHIDVSAIADFSFMFQAIDFEGDISRWNTSNALYMSGMFEKSSFNGDISQWDVSNVQDMSYMFTQSSFNQPLQHWDVSRVVSMDWMFHRNTDFSHDLSSWNMGRVCSTALMMDSPCLVRIAAPGPFHWAALIEDADCLVGHPQETALQEHLASMVHVLQGLGLSKMQTVMQLQRLWESGRPNAAEVWQLPSLGP